MGSQQLLLILVDVIIVGLMIYAGMELTRTYFESSNRDQLISTLNDLGVLAQQYYRKAELGGGGGSYLGWNLPSNFSKTDAGKFKVTVRANRVDFTATGKETGLNDKGKVKVTCRVDQNGIRMTITN